VRVPASISLRRVFHVVVIAVAAAAVALFVFTPRFALWRGLDIRPAWFNPEVNRAVDTLRQLAHPFAAARDPSNLVIEWRLLFPLLGKALALPPWLFLSLPHLGCLIVLGFVARLLLRQGWSGYEALLAAIVMATCSWFFVSTGWLAYFDSWCVLALLLVSFARREWVLAAAVLAGPWIDERFVLALPLALVVRDRYLESFGLARPGRPRWRDAAWCGAALLPWLAIRLGAHFFHHDRVSAGYAHLLLAPGNAIPLSAYAAGAWQSLRWAWVLVFVWLAVETRFAPRRLAWPVAVAVATLGASLAAAHDFSRAPEAVLPAVVLGLMLLRASYPRRARTVLIAVCGLNLVFPARHVVANWDVPIYYFYAELARARQPPPELDPQALNARAIELARANDLAVALDFLDGAVRLDARYAEARQNRAVVEFDLGRIADAVADSDAALKLAPRNPDLLHTHARICAKTGDARRALADVTAALREAPADWPQRAAAEALLAALRRLPPGR